MLDRSRTEPHPVCEGYDPKDYELYVLYVRVFQTGWRETFDKFDRIPNHKTDTNNHGPFSTDFIGMNYDYPDASHERRKEIIDAHVKYQQGLMYFFANDDRVPADVKTLPVGRYMCYIKPPATESIPQDFQSLVDSSLTLDITEGKNELNVKLE